MQYNKVALGDLLLVLTDYHANGAYKKLKENVELLDEEDFALMVRTTNFENNDFSSSLKFISEHAYNFLEKSKVYGGDLIMNKIANAGSIYLMPDLKCPVSLAMNLFLIRVDETKANPVYVYIYLKVHEAYVKQFANGSVTKTITKEAVRNLEISLPPRNIQDQIAEHYGSLSKKIEVNSRINQTLEEMAQAIFKSWFVDFDPVKAKMNGEQPEGMDAATASLFPEKLVESELGLIPEGWDVGTLSDVAKYCSARTKTDTITLENYISTENMLAEKKGVTAASKLPTAKTVAAYKSGDILVSNIRPYFKKIWLAEGSGGRSNDVLGFESVSANTESYLMNVLYQDTFFEYMTRTSKGAKMPRGDKTAIMNWEMAVPPVELREAFSAIVDKFYQLIPQNRAQNATLESLRDTLLPKLLSGELSLTDSLEVTNV